MVYHKPPTPNNPILNDEKKLATNIEEKTVEEIFEIIENSNSENNNEINEKNLIQKQERDKQELHIDKSCDKINLSLTENSVRSKINVENKTEMLNEFIPSPYFFYNSSPREKYFSQKYDHKNSKSCSPNTTNSLDETFSTNYKNENCKIRFEYVK